ncbi:MAG: tetratricopeptide repeat protein, partial [Chloroflexota bacterium]
MTSARERSCSTCGSKVAEEAKFCPSCGRWLLKRIKPASSNNLTPNSVSDSENSTAGYDAKPPETGSTVVPSVIKAPDELPAKSSIRQISDDVKARADIHFDQALNYLDQNELDEAIREFKAALLLSPGYTEAYYNLGVIYGQQGHWNAATRAYQ